jgi:hypothetical protein
MIPQHIFNQILLINLFLYIILIKSLLYKCNEISFIIILQMDSSQNDFLDV